MRIFDDKGITLYELLAAITILAIVLPVIYGVFQSGLSLYNKIQIEGQIRDDADYAVSMMMNSFNSIPFDYVTIEGDSKISLYDTEKTVFEKNTKENSSFYTYDKEKIKPENAKVSSIAFVDHQLKNEAITSVSINNQILEGSGDFTGSKVRLSCSKTDPENKNRCLHGLIHITFIIDQARLNRPLTLESQFGF
ncbi:hypothetical protein CHH55_19000 [Niallia circulans]|uniref:type II secretion system protein n=1 Tax=Niallia circulans TaxID=1397 RepID=UPI000BA4FF9D|nr:hypothetical protein [Niallia circulans]MCM2980564.1 hypothetical protein [Niallia circulans]PAD26212.1 hypothetical protein CHH62_08450 [Niallia circulans]PAD86300.1 hypothetical protein CHH55_19000 [Niallia circulans]